MKKFTREMAGKHVVVAVSSVVVLGALVAAPHVVRGSGSDADRAAIVQLVHDSQLAEQTLCLAPSSAVASGRVQAMSSSVVDGVRATVSRVESSYYTGNELSGLTDTLQQNCTAALTHGQSLEIAGGVGPITCSQVTVSGDQAHATCQLVKWLRSRIVTSAGEIHTVQPSALTIVNDDFTRTASGWRITNEEFHPAPGYGP